MLCEILDNLVNCMLYTLRTKFHKSHLSASNFETGVHTECIIVSKTHFTFSIRKQAKSMTSCYSVEGKNVCVSATLKAEFCSFTGPNRRCRRHMHQPSVLTSAMVSGPNRHADIACPRRHCTWPVYMLHSSHWTLAAVTVSYSSSSSSCIRVLDEP